MLGNKTMIASFLALLLVALVEARSDMVHRFMLEAEHVYDKTEITHENKQVPKQRQRLRGQETQQQSLPVATDTHVHNDRKLTSSIEELNAKMKETLMEELFQDDFNFYARASGSMSNQVCTLIAEKSFIAMRRRRRVLTLDTFLKFLNVTAFDPQLSFKSKLSVRSKFAIEPKLAI
jgi:hypothetical protein